jgi:hypothetical protein
MKHWEKRQGYHRHAPVHVHLRQEKQHVHLLGIPAHLLWRPQTRLVSPACQQHWSAASAGPSCVPTAGQPWVGLQDRTHRCFPLCATHTDKATKGVIQLPCKGDVVNVMLHPRRQHESHARLCAISQSRAQWDTTVRAEARLTWLVLTALPTAQQCPYAQESQTHTQHALKKVCPVSATYMTHMARNCFLTARSTPLPAGL